MEGLDIFKHYSNLGYDVFFTRIYGKEGLKMIKRYSYKAERPLICTQIFEYSDKTEKDIKQCFQYMYEDIQEQEETGKYYEEL